MNVMRKKEAAQYLGISLQDLNLAIRTEALKAAIAVDPGTGKPFEGIVKDSAESLADDMMAIDLAADSIEPAPALDPQPIRLRYDRGSMVINPDEFFTGAGASDRAWKLHKLMPELTEDCWNAKNIIRERLLEGRDRAEAERTCLENIQKYLVNSWIAYHGPKSFYGVYAKRRFDAAERRKKEAIKNRDNFNKWATWFA